MYGAVGTDVNQRNRVGKSMLTFEFMTFKPFDVLKNLVPMNCCVNMKEIIPGLDTDIGRFPEPRPNFSSPYVTTPLKLKSKQPIYLHNISLKCNSEFERQFESFLRHVVSTENGGQNAIVAPVMIS